MRTWPLIRCLWLLGLAPVWEPFAGTAQSPPAKPNILILFADDLGYWDLGVQGCTDIPTPNIDSIAKNGVRFTSGYVSGSMCSPSRAGLLTGRSQSRFGHEINWDENTYSDTCGLPLTEKTIADQLRIAGYRTGPPGNGTPYPTLCKFGMIRERSRSATCGPRCSIPPSPWRWKNGPP